MNGRGPYASPGYHLWHGALAWKQVIGEALAPLDLTATQFFFLGVLRWMSTEESRTPSQRELADRAGIDAMTTSQVVRALERKGLLVRRSHPGDSRVKAVELTREGERVMRQALPGIQAAERRFFAGLGAGRDAFIDSLRALRRTHMDDKEQGQA